METDARGTGGMDLLKDITEGLRGNTETRGTAEARRGDPGGNSGSSRRGSDRRCASEDGDEDGTDEDSAADSGDGNREDQHVCSFCETEFDADRGVCPECDAEIVFRGQR